MADSSAGSTAGGGVAGGVGITASKIQHA